MNKIKPNPAQELALEAAIPALLYKKRALIDMATGLGKTFTGAFLVQKLKYRRVLFLVHNNFILENSMKEFKEVLGDKPVMALYNGVQKDGAEKADIVFATWQTMSRNRSKWKKNHFELIVVDEAHHTEAEVWKPAVTYFSGDKLGLTATPDRADQKDIRSVFGKEVIKLTLEEAIAAGWLPRIEYHVITDETVDENVLAEITKEIKEKHAKFSKEEINKRLFIRKRDEEIAKIINSHPEKAVVFCANILHADRFVKHLDLADTFHSKRSRHSDGGMASGSFPVNQRVLSQFRRGVVQRVCAVNAFNEGVDVPSMGLVAFCRSTSSETIFRQQLGRGLRPGKDKLIVLDFVANLDRVLAIRKMMDDIADIHEEMTPQEEREREGYKRDKFEVSGAGFKFTFSDQIVDALALLEGALYAKKITDYYPTSTEARAAIIRLGIKDSAEYRVRRFEDPRLVHSPPNIYPDKPSWRWLTGGELPYTTLVEMKAAVVKLGIKTGKEYSLRYKEDRRLISSPQKVYADWVSWPVFFGQRTREWYPTLQQAQAASKRLKIKSITEYKVRYIEDNKLPSSPDAVYPSKWVSWFDFFGNRKPTFYKTKQEAVAAIRRLGIKTRKAYTRGEYKEDPKLPSSPGDVYVNWDWAAALGRTKKVGLIMAKQIVKQLGITTSTEYRQRWREDRRLLSGPHCLPGWIDWYDFLGK